MPAPKDLTKKEEWKKHLSESHKGYQLSEETKIKISEANKGHKGYWLGKKMNEEIKRKMSETRKGKKINHPISKRLQEKMTKSKQTLEYRELRSKIRLNIILPVKDTSIERKMQDEFSSREIGYCKHIPVCGICQPDITFPDKKIAVFCDGDYWHNLSNYKIRDAKQNEILKNAGWLVLRYWEHEINANVEAIVDEIEEILMRVRA
ncbi:MAG: Very-short-patch-repair endonuclease [Candidatus Fermentimicrarchaeum limneticum]|uniref:Very-short-patch-repair endonuclease n=1 Tax=Fermentimicrarchaeum limneticum TaxID=2795018 RepID=A0A7D5XH95_FERL1|nr:MAG: Very-short-patch-repair endonuclease [Candidatus Fermentimicrarchaeum limneticum]QLJ52575.1 MAG: Very-short-patch-repair endonuclease [Candidatus Fermentimicrarchaeum limneticum]QLJ52612.1 MAG: Very-short-patch-repair endonuclease [Candidatus Fermentimicrarchaeum limneticum]